MNIQELADTVAEETTERFVCPMCGGGSSGERSLAISRYRTGYAWFCHRASCGYRGSSTEFRSGPLPKRDTHKVTAGEEMLRKTSNPSARAYRDGQSTFSNTLSDDLKYLSHVDLEKYSVYRDPDDFTRIIFVLYDTDGIVRGVHTRQRYNQYDKVCRTYPVRAAFVPGPVYGFYDGDKSRDTCWIVEDPISAIRIAASGRRAVSAMGTNISRDLVSEVALSPRGVQTIILALDKDATLKAFERAYAVKQEIGVNCIPVMLNEDVKNMSLKDFVILMSLYDPAP